MNTQEERSLFRQQVIDEFNSRLNGEVILKSDFSVRFLALIFVWLAVGAIIISSIKVDLSQNITGVLTYDQHKNLLANFLISPDRVDDFYPERIIEVELQHISSKQPVVLPIKIIGVDNKLNTASSIAMVNVSAVVQASQVQINNKEFKLGEGIMFSFSLGHQKVSLITWLGQRYFSGDKYGNQ